MPQTPSPTTGLPNILAALETGGMPQGQLGKLPSPTNPQAAMPGAMPTGTPMPTQAGVMPEVSPDLIQALLEALLRGGQFNQLPTPSQTPNAATVPGQ